MTLKELALAVNTDQEIVIIEENEQEDLVKTKYFKDSEELFNDSLHNVLWDNEFYNRKVLWFNPNRNGKVWVRIDK